MIGDSKNPAGFLDHGANSAEKAAQKGRGAQFWKNLALFDIFAITRGNKKKEVRNGIEGQSVVATNKGYSVSHLEGGLVQAFMPSMAPCASLVHALRK
jgi:hypothetical protein